MNSILTRRSIRKYTGKEVTDEQLKELLKAGMSAPSAGNEQPWHFIIIRSKETFEKIMKVHPYSKMLAEASAAIAVCGDESRQIHEGYWVQDCSAATENILIQANDMGLGAVWLGVYPRTDRVEAIKKILELPPEITPLCLISIGYPAETKEPANRYDEKRIHYEKW